MIIQKIKHNSYKLIAVILIMSFVFSLMPFSAYATEFAPVEESVICTSGWKL